MQSRSTQPKKLSIFLSSPGDVGEERQIAIRVIRRVEGRFAAYFKLEPILWEWEPLLATEAPQSQIIRPSSADIMVCILWSRLGTPLGDAIRRPDGTAYLSGTEFEFEDAAESWRENGTPDLMVYHKKAPPLVSLDDMQLEERRQQRRRLDEFIDSWCRNQDGSFRAIFHDVSDAADFEIRLEKHLTELLRAKLPSDATAPEDASQLTWTSGSPFRGLAVFDAEHRDIYHGRTRAISEIKQRLVQRAAAGAPLLVVLGASGSGKSSLIRAGVIPLLTQAGVIEGVAHWGWAVFRPTDAQRDPLLSLAGALLEAVPLLAKVGYEDQALLASLLREQPEHLIPALDAALRLQAEQDGVTVTATASQLRVLLGLDQMEELFSNAAVSDEDRHAFASAVSALVLSERVWIIATMRSDFYSQLAALEELRELKGSDGQYDLVKPTGGEIAQIITQPASAAGLVFQTLISTGETLDDLLRTSAERSENGLPLLQFTLEQLYQLRDGRTLTFDAYEQLGGLEGAIAQRAEEVFASLTPEAKQTFPRVLRALVSVGADQDKGITAQRVPLDLLGPSAAAKQAVDAFIAARLFVSDVDLGGRAVVAVAHEALLRHWQRAKDLISDDLAFLRVRDQIQNACRRWAAESQDSDFLLPAGRQLDEASRLLDERGDELDAEAKAYIRQSHARVMRRRYLKRRVAGAVGAVFTAMVIGFSLYSFAQWRIAETARDGEAAQTDLAMQRADEAEAARQLAQQHFESTLRTADELAVESIRGIRWTLGVSTPQKLWLAEQFDQSFSRLRDDVQDSPAIRQRHAELLVANAHLLFEVGQWSRASEYARRAAKMIFDEDGRPSPAASPLAPADCAYAMARTAYADDDADGVYLWLDRAEQSLAGHGAAVDPTVAATFAMMISQLRISTLAGELRYDEAADVAVETIQRYWRFEDAPEADESLTEADRSALVEYQRLLNLRRVTLNRLGRMTDEDSADAAADIQTSVAALIPDPFDIKRLQTTLYLADPQVRVSLAESDTDSAALLANEAVDSFYAALREDPENRALQLSLAGSLHTRVRVHASNGDLQRGERDLSDALRLISHVRKQGHDPEVQYADFFNAHLATLLWSRAGTERHSTNADRINSVLDSIDQNTSGLRWRYALPYLRSDRLGQLMRAERYREAVEAGMVALPPLDDLGRHPITSSDSVLIDHRATVLWYFVRSAGFLENPDERAAALALAERHIDRWRFADFPGADPDIALCFSALASLHRLDDDPNQARRYRDLAFRAHVEAIDVPERSSVQLGNMIYEYREAMKYAHQRERHRETIELAEQICDLVSNKTPQENEAENSRAHWRSFRSAKQRIFDALEADSPRDFTDADFARMTSVRARASSIQRTFDAFAEKIEAQQSSGPITASLPDLRNFNLPATPVKNALEVKSPEDDLNWKSKPMFPSLWETLDRQRAMEFAAVFDSRNILAGAELLRMRLCEPAFYNGVQLLECEYRNADGRFGIVSYLIRDSSLYLLNGTSPPIHEVNAKAPLRLDNAATALNYLRFFCAYVSGEEGSFQIVESALDIPFKDSASATVRRMLSDALRPAVCWPDPEMPGHWRAIATIHYSTAIFWAEFRIQPTGMVEMLSDSPIGADLPIERPILADRGRRQDLDRSIDLDALGITWAADDADEARD